jgi:hypothetical protein
MRTSPFFAVVLTAASLLFCVSSHAEVAASPPTIQPDTEFVILTHSVTREAFERLALARTAQGIRAEVVVVSCCDPAPIREALRIAYTSGALRAVLIGGTPDRVPMRTVMRLAQSGTGGDTIPTDLYYAALDGSWDADGDRVFGEVPWRYPYDRDPEDDQVDFVAELQVGRVPVRTVQQAEIFVSKVLSVDGFAADFEAEYDRALLLVASPYPLPAPVFRFVAQDIVTARGWDAAEYTWLEGGSDLLPPAQPLSIAAIAQRWSDSTQGLIIHLGAASHDGLSLSHERFGESSGQWTPNETRNLTNVDRLPLLVSMTAPESYDDDAVAADAVLQPVAGASGAVAFSRCETFTPVAELTREFVAALGEKSTVGEAFLAAQRWAATEFAGELRLSGLLAWMLIGDPTMPSPTYHGEVTVGTPTDLARVRDLRVQPNPFNPRTVIRVAVEGRESLEARVDVYDLRGRRVRSLFAGEFESGTRELAWDGRDDQGAAAASGVYAVRLEAGHQVLQRKVTLVR